MTFLASIKDKQLDFTPFNLLRFRDWASKHEGTQVRIEQVSNKRSDNQNRYYWAVLDIISEHTGHTSEELHRLFKGLFLPKKEVKLGGETYFLAGSTTDLSTQEFMDYIDRIGAKIAPMELALPNPDEYKKGLDVVELK